LIIRYDTRNAGKNQDIVITFPDDFKTNVLEENGINLGRNTLLQKISIG
jgi:tRNA nucleotidyltransferase (CCA-adding enzyme)